MLDVPSHPASVSIKDFVATQPGLTFKAGRGYYEFTKPEAISKKKHIVLMADDGTLYEGDTARSIANIGDDEKKKVRGDAGSGARTGSMRRIRLTPFVLWCEISVQLRPNELDGFTVRPKHTPQLNGEIHGGCHGWRFSCSPICVSC